MWQPLPRKGKKDSMIVEVFLTIDVDEEKWREDPKQAILAAWLDDKSRLETWHAHVPTSDDN